MKAKRLAILSALGSALVTRVPIDRCRSPSSHFRTPLHLLTTAILMRSPSRLVNIRTLKSSLQSSAPHGFYFYLSYLSCKVKKKKCNLGFVPKWSFKTCIRTYVLMTYVRMYVVSCTFCYNDVHEYTRCLHSAKMIHCARVYVYRSICIYVAPVCLYRRITGQSYIHLRTCTCILRNINIKKKNIF